MFDKMDYEECKQFLIKFELNIGVLIRLNDIKNIRCDLNNINLHLNDTVHKKRTVFSF